MDNNPTHVLNYLRVKNSRIFAYPACLFHFRISRLLHPARPEIVRLVRKFSRSLDFPFQKVYNFWGEKNSRPYYFSNQLKILFLILERSTQVDFSWRFVQAKNKKTVSLFDISAFPIMHEMKLKYLVERKLLWNFIALIVAKGLHCDLVLLGICKL